MSARPDVPRLAEEELDLLISRSLDGDLSPEEEQQLERLVTLDPAAARRKAELSALVADMKALPEPATPFALSTRVNSNVSERAGRPGSLGGRVGFFPAPGFAKVALVVLGIVGAAIAILRPVPRRPVEGPVDVLLYNPAQTASSAPQALVAEANPDARAKGLAKEKTASNERAFAPEVDEKRIEAERPPSEEAAREKKAAAGKLEDVRRNEVGAAAGAPAVAEASSKQASDRDGGAALDAAREQAPAKVTSSGALAPAAPAPAAAPAQAGASGAPARDGESRVPRGWTVSVRGDAVRRWSLRRAPDNPPPARGTAVYRVTLDASGRVSALSRVGAAPADPRLDAFVRGMVFEPVASRADRAEIQTKIAAKDAPAALPDFEIELTPR